MSYRLPADVNLIGYWGLDEAMETDLGLDEGLNARHLTVTSSPAVEEGRVGNARTFDGTSTFASPASSVPFQLIGDMTIITWFQMTSVNSSGSFLRTIFSCDGPLTSDNVLYSLSVDSSGRLIYQHTGATGAVVLRTPIDTVRINQIYNVTIRRIDAGGSTQNIELYINHRLTNWTDVTVNAVPAVQPIPSPVTSGSATLKIGRTHKVADSAFWHGFVDETSIHDAVRVISPYLNTVYFSQTVNNPTNKLTGGGDAKRISSYDTGTGGRWWCFERNGDLYVTKEPTLGKFSTEIKLTQVSGDRFSTAQKPELIYDQATDTLYVFFIAGNRVFKLTANSADTPSTIGLPLTADTVGVIKSLDHQDGGRVGDGGGNRDPLNSDFVYVNRAPIKLNLQDQPSHNVGDGGGDQFTFTRGTPDQPVLNFTSVSPTGFGLAVGPVNAEMSGYAIYRIDGGRLTQLSSPVQIADFMYLQIPVRGYGNTYIAEALDIEGRKSGLFSEAVVDKFTEMQVDLNNNYVYGRDGIGTDAGSLGDGGGNRDPLNSDFVYVNRAPIKLNLQDQPSHNVGDGGGQSGSATQAGVTVMI